MKYQLAWQRANKDKFKEYRRRAYLKNPEDAFNATMKRRGKIKALGEIFVRVQNKSRPGEGRPKA